MGDLQAPPELWQGVSTQLIVDKLETQQAPSGLWDVVHTQLTEEGVIARPAKIFSLRLARACPERATLGRKYCSITF